MRALITKIAAVLAVVLAVLHLAASESAARKLADLIPGLYGGDGLFLATAPVFNHTAHFAIDSAAAINQLNEQIATEVGILPFSSSVGAFTFEFQEALGTFVRTTQTLGPLFTERAPTLGLRRLNVHASFTAFKYHTFEGRSLNSVQVTARHDPDVIGSPDVREQFENDVILMDVDVDIFVQILSLAATYGITDRLDVGVLLPLVRVDMEVESTARVVVSPDNPFPGVHTFEGGPESPNDAASDEATGLGDVVVRGKYHLLEGGALDVAGAVLARLETGDERDFLGTGSTAIRPFLVLSRTFFGAFTPHLNVGYEFDLEHHHQNALEYAAGFDAGTGSVTVVGDVIGSHELDGDGIGDDIVNGSVGVKWNPFARFIVFANVQFPLNESGLRSNVTPTVGVEYTF